MKIKINDQEFTTPFMVGADPLELKWIAEQMLKRAKRSSWSPDMAGGYIVFHIETDEDAALEEARWRQNWEDQILRQAEEIKERRKEAGFG